MVHTFLLILIEMAEKNKKGKITLDKLAVMVGNGFNVVDRRFEQVDKKLDDMNGRLGRVEDKVENIDYQLFELNSKVDNLEVSLTKEKKQSDKRISRLESAVFVKN